MITAELNNIIIRMHEQEKVCVRLIAERVDLSVKTVNNIIAKYENGIQFIPAVNKYTNTVNNKNGFLSHIEQTLFNTVSRNNSMIQKEMQEYLATHDNASISQPTISRKLKKLKITRKRLSLIPAERNSAINIDARAVYAADISRFPQSNLIFLDETGVNLHTSRSYGYSVENTKAYRTVPANRGTNISCMCVIGIQGVIAYDTKIGAYNKESFIEFLEQKLKNYIISHPNTILIMDNARFHHANIVMSYARDNNFNIKFLTPYSPQLNPIEEFFSMLKSKITALEYSLTIQEKIGIVMQSNFGEACQGFYKSMTDWLEKARSKQPFI